jgi:hypothetical protein
VHGKKAASARSRVGVVALRLSLALIPLTLISCGGAVNQPLEETITQTYPLDANASINITNEDGSIRIYGGGDELKVQATKKAYSVERLRRIKINIVVGADSVEITTDYPPKKKWGFSDRSGTVDYIVVVPETARLVRAELADGELSVEGLRGGSVQARLANGLLSARNCFSDLELTLATGNLSLSFDWWEQTAFVVNGAVTRGNIRSFIPGDASFHIQAEAPQGKIGNDFLEKENRHAEPANKIDMVVGSGGEIRMKLRANNGNIRIAETNP